MKKLIMIRGPSGSGKSTLARLLAQQTGASFMEADQYFSRDGKTYAFDASQLGAAHKYCQDNVRDRMIAEDDTVIVSNTSMTKWETNPYLQMAGEFGYDVVIYRTKGPWDAEALAKRNVHGVSEVTILKQISKYQPLENEEEYNG